jgi:hypothetical protein
MPKDPLQSFTLKDLSGAKIKYLQNSTMIGNTPATVVRFVLLILNTWIIMYNDIQMTAYIRGMKQTYDWSDKLKYLNEWVLFATSFYFLYGIFGIPFHDP